MPSSFPGAYVRIAGASDYDEVIRIMTCAFLHDPSMNWFGGVGQMVPAYQDEPDYGSHPAHARCTYKSLHIFQSALVKATILSGGFATVAVVSDEKEGSEKIVGTALWLKPGQTLDFPLTVLIRSGIWRVLFAWGFEGIMVRPCLCSQRVFYANQSTRCCRGFFSSSRQPSNAVSRTVSKRAAWTGVTPGTFFLSPLIHPMRAKVISVVPQMST